MSEADGGEGFPLVLKGQAQDDSRSEAPLPGLRAEGVELLDAEGHLPCWGFLQPGLGLHGDGVYDCPSGHLGGLATRLC